MLIRTLSITAHHVAR
jgi:syntaxin 16